MPDGTHPAWLEQTIGWYREGDDDGGGISRRLNEARVRPRYGRIREWTLSKIYELLRLMQVQTRAPSSAAHFDKREGVYDGVSSALDGRHAVYCGSTERRRATTAQRPRSIRGTRCRICCARRCITTAARRETGAVSEGNRDTACAKSVCDWRRPGTFRSAVVSGIRRR